MSDKNKFATFTDGELAEERSEVHGKMKEFLDVADKRDGDNKGKLTAEENERWNKLNDRYDEIGTELTARKAAREEQANMAERRKMVAERDKDMGKGGRKTTPDGEERKPEGKDLEARHAAYRKWAEYGPHANLTPGERRALQADADHIGGSFVPDEVFVNRLIKFVDDAVYIRQLATVLPLTGAESVGIPSWDTDPADADWTSELNSGSEDSSAATGKRKMTPYPLAKRIKISKSLIRKSAIPVESLITDRMGYKFAVSEEKAFLLGTGQNQPLGLFTASANGINTDRDVSTGNTSSSITGDGLINAMYALKSQYMASPATRWLFHRDALKQVRLLKDGQGNYLWNRGLAGAPDTILEKPYLSSEFASNTFTSGLYVGMIGDFSHYWIVESMKMELMRLDELYAETNQVGFIGRMELDAQPVLSEAFVRVKLG